MLVPKSSAIACLQRCQLISANLRRGNILVGTSSWKYEGWLGQFYSPERYEYRGKIAKTRFETECLSEYAETFRTVCVDAGFYQFPDEKYIGNLASQVPVGFLLSFKATDEITIKHFPNQQRHGERARKPNENFLNAVLFADAFLGPMSPHREKIGVIMFASIPRISSGAGTSSQRSMRSLDACRRAGSSESRFESGVPQARILCDATASRCHSCVQRLDADAHRE
jgi:hypothetical protein